MFKVSGQFNAKKNRRVSDAEEPKLILGNLLTSIALSGKRKLYNIAKIISLPNREIEIK